MYDTTIAAKLLRQLESFLGRISPHFHKPVARFIGDMVYGIMVEKDVKLSSIVRALKEKTTPKKVEDRLSRMLSSDGLEAGLHGFIASEGSRRVRKDTLIILDPSDVQKPYAKKMEYLAKVWDGSKGDVGDNLGFWGCMAVACESGGRRPIPLHFRLWSADSPGFVSENEEVKAIVGEIAKRTKKRGIFVYNPEPLPDAGQVPRRVRQGEGIGGGKGALRRDGSRPRLLRRFLPAVRRKREHRRAQRRHTGMDRGERAGALAPLQDDHAVQGSRHARQAADGN